MSDYPHHYAKSIKKVQPGVDPKITGFVRGILPTPFSDVDAPSHLALSDHLADQGHPAADLFSRRPDRISSSDFSSARGGPGGEFSYFRPLASEGGFLYGVTSPGISHNWAGIKLHAIPLHPDYTGKATGTLTRQALGTRVLPLSFNRVLGHTATKKFTEALPEGGLKRAMEGLLANGGHYFHETSPDYALTYHLHANPQTDAEHQKNIHLDTKDDTHADKYGEWMEEQGDPIGGVVREHTLRRGQPTRHNNALYGGRDWVDHRGGKVSVGKTRMYNGVPHADLMFAVPHPDGGEWPRHPRGHLVPAWLSWSRYAPVSVLKQQIEGLPQQTKDRLNAALDREPEPEE